MSTNTFFTSDLHLGHANIARFCDRPFPHGPEGVDEMNEAIITRWNEQVSDGDMVYVLGDVAMGRIAETLPMVGRLAGRKILVTGNHDRCWPGLGAKAAEWEMRYRDAGFAAIRHGGINTRIKSHEVVLHHFPYTGDSGAEDRYAEHRPTDDGGWLIHGHVHDVWRQRGRMINVGLDAWGGRLVSSQTLADLMDAGPSDIGPERPWPGLA